MAAESYVPIDRTWIDASSRPLRGLVGAGFVAFSSYATVFLVAQDVEPIFGNGVRLALLADRYWLGLVAALVFFLGETLTAERWPRIYQAILVPDTIYTARQMYAGFRAVFNVIMTDFITVCMIVGIIAALVLLVAYAVQWDLWWWLLGTALASAPPVGTAWYTYHVDPRADYAPLVLSTELAVFCGYIVARFGESLLFGSRRAPQAGAKRTRPQLRRRRKT